jgi:Zn-finger nucleic acid-binding protein
MTRLEEDGIRSCICQQCFGRWIGTTPLHRRVRLDVELLQTAPPAEAPNPSTPAAPDPLEDLVAIVAESNTKTSLRCPTCEKPMTKDRFHQMIPVQIDRCRHCDSIWLDTGEYALIRRLYVEMFTSTDPRIVALREKIAGARLVWDERERVIAHARDIVDAGNQSLAPDIFTAADINSTLPDNL